MGDFLMSSLTKNEAKFWKKKICFSKDSTW